MPNLSDWRPGDIVLVRKAGGLAGAMLAAGQAASFSTVSRAGSDWTHAALYVGNGEVVEAVPDRGVVRRSLWHYCQDRSLRVRRLIQPFSRRDGQLAADYAVGLLGRPYSIVELARSKLWPATHPNPDALYCSTFVGFVIAASTSRVLYQRPEHRPLHPAVLAVHEDLEDVGLEWRALGHRP